MSENTIFSRERLAGYNPEKMACSVALVVGAGALGQNTVQNLALSGIGEIRLVDKDRFEEHNRTRSPAYPLAEEQGKLGLAKARVVSYKLKRLMTATNPIMRYADAWIQELGDGAFTDVSVIISCVDTPAARAYLSDKARFHGIPFIEGGFDGAEITLSCYPASIGAEAITAPCWRCSHQELEGAFSCRFYAEQIEKSGYIPAIQNAAATLAGLQSEAAVLVLHDQMPLMHQALDFNIRTGKTRSIRLSTDPHCPGIHRSLDAKPIKLQSSSQNTVRVLLEELKKYFKDGATIQLQHPLVWTAPCTQTGKMTAVHSPDWLWIMMPRCKEAGGLFPALDGVTVSDSPSVYSDLSLESASEPLAAICGQIGLPSMSLVEAEPFFGNAKSIFFQLSGMIDELFQTVPE